MIYHWNDTDWTRQPSPNPPSGGTLNGVAAASASDAWAVGGTGTGTGSDFSALIEHWNGTVWNVVPVPASVGAPDSSSTR